MIYEEPKVDVIEFAEGEIVTDLTGQASGDETGGVVPDLSQWG